jgi:ribosomal protein S18 acetylase RimI-like enzyme
MDTPAIGVAMNALHDDVWLTGMLGYRAVRVEAPDAIASVAGRVFAYAKVAATDVARVHALESEGFRLVDTNVQLEKARGIGTIRAQAEFRHARAEDEDAVARLAGEGFEWSRFHLDPHFTPEQAARIKAEWTRNYFRGKRGQAMIVAEVDGAIAGFNQLLKMGETLTIDLIAVEARYRRRGIAAGLIAFAEHEHGEVTTIRVGTQLANTVSLRLYESLGFRVVSAQYVLHYHRT